MTIDRNKKNAASEYRSLSKMGFISLEEVDEEESAQLLSAVGKVASYDRPTKKSKKSEEEAKPATTTDKAVEANEPTVITKIHELPAWSEFPLDAAILKGLAKNSFHEPTAVQRSVLEVIFKNPKKDILGCAPTGSGKTLAFLLPILNKILVEKLTGLSAIIIVPTRELALQIKDHFEKVSPDSISAVTLVGGLSQEKQERLLGYQPNILIGTPGRLAEILSGNSFLQSQLSTTLRYLILDEADRLCEVGHFKDLDIIFELFQSNPNPLRQTFLFSATLQDTQLSSLKKKLRFNDRHPTLINLGIQFPTLLEHYQISCLAEEKLMWLCALLGETKRGRVLIFVNTIELVRDLAHDLNLLGFSTGALHAQMQQRQRIKSLERFRSNSSSVLVTSDVAARGLDIPSVDTVIHYHIPKNSDIFVHRSGRTARANHSGKSISLVSPHEVLLFKRLQSSTLLSIPEHQLLSTQVEIFKKATTLAEKIRKIETKQKKISRTKSWEEKAAEELGVDLEFRSKRNDFDDDGLDGFTKKKQQIQLASLKSQLSEILANINNKRN